VEIDMFVFMFDMFAVHPVHSQNHSQPAHQSGLWRFINKFFYWLFFLANTCKKTLYIHQNNCSTRKLCTHS